MTTSSAWMICKGLLQSCGLDPDDVLLNYLHPALLGQVRELPPALFSPPVSTISQTIEMIHFSWFAPFLRTFSEKEILMVSSALTSSQQKGLQKILFFSNSALKPTALAKQFYQKMLVEELTKDAKSLLPMNALPFSEMNRLLEFGSKELTKIFAYLGLYDLAIEMKQIIESAKLKKIYSCLSAPHREFLGQIFPKKEGAFFQKFSLQNWDGTAQAMLAMLEQKGINRFAKALAGEDTSLLWYLVHHLDEKYASTFEHFRASSTSSKKTEKILYAQVLKVIEYSRGES